jgi:uncharacterized protein (TIGR02246 family)
MSIQSWITDLFKTIDSRDPVKFADFLTPDGEFIFGNLPPVQGRENIITFLDAFFKSIHSISHRVDNCWAVEDRVIVEGFVTYTRHNNTTLVVKFCDIFTMSDNLIKKFDIFIDNSRL